MITPELISYLEECDRMGVRKEQAMTALLAAGWRLPHIQEGFKIMEARQTPMNQPRFIVPAFHLSLSLLVVLVLGTGVAVLTINYVNHAPLNGNNLQANIIQTATNTAPTESDLIAQQINNVSAITDSLEIYKEITGYYPTTLLQLKKTGNEIFQSVSTTSPMADHDKQYILGLYGGQPLYDKDLTDLFSNTAFLYNTDGNTYSLSYLLRWTTPQSSTIENQFVNGWNTAKKDSLSVLKHG